MDLWDIHPAKEQKKPTQLLNKSDKYLERLLQAIVFALLWYKILVYKILDLKRVFSTFQEILRCLLKPVWQKGSLNLTAERNQESHRFVILYHTQIARGLMTFILTCIHFWISGRIRCICMFIVRICIFVGSLVLCFLLQMRP